MKIISFDNSKSYSIPDLYLNIGHLLDHFMMLIFAKAAFDAGREFGLSYEEIIVYGTLGVVLFGAAAPLAGWLADKYSRAILITVYPFGLGLGSYFSCVFTINRNVRVVAWYIRFLCCNLPSSRNSNDC